MKLLECVDVEAVRAHQAGLQAIATAHGGHRSAGSAGYDASVDYVVRTLAATGWQVTVQPFQVQTFDALAPALLERVAPSPPDRVPTTVLSYSGSGDVTAPMSSPVGDTGCTAADWAGFPVGGIALVERGQCTFGTKASAGIAAGAGAVVVYNNDAGPLEGTLGSDFTGDLPAVAVTQAIGQQLARTPGLRMRVKTDTVRRLVTTSNVLAELAGQDPADVVMAGAHLDSVPDGPGSNDNGSGSAALLEVAQQLGRVRPHNTVRLAWWGAEEAVLVGSTHYVANLPRSELDRIALYLNFDMIGSPNHVLFVYDGDDSDGEGAGPGPAGSAQIEVTFEEFFASRGLPVKGTDFSGRSDYGPFIEAGIPAGGLFTGAEGIKTAGEAALWGGTAGVAYDPCYHQACDTYANVNVAALDVNSDAIAYATLKYAMSTELVNGGLGNGEVVNRLTSKPGNTGYVAGPGPVRG